MLSSSTLLFVLLVALVIIGAAVVPELVSGMNFRRIVQRTMLLSLLVIVVLVGYLVLVDNNETEATTLVEVVTATPEEGGSGFPVVQITPIETAVPPTATNIPIRRVTATNTAVPPPPIATTAPVIWPRAQVDPSLPINTLFPAIPALPQGVSTGTAEFVSNSSVGWPNTNPGNTMGRLYSYERFYGNEGLCGASNGLYGIYTQIIFFENPNGAAQFYNWALSNAAPNNLVGERGYSIVSPQATNGCTVQRYTVAFQRANVFYKVRVLIHQDATELLDDAEAFAWAEAYRMDAHLSSLIR